MNKQEFLSALRARLQDLGEEDIRRALDYYCEILSDRMDEGLTEEAAVAALGPLDEIEDQIRQESSHPEEDLPGDVPPSATESPSAGKGYPMPHWLGQILRLVAGIILKVGFLGLLLTMWSAVIGMYVAVVSLVAGAVTGFVGGPLALGLRQERLALSLGMGLLCLGLGILLLLGANATARASARLGRWGRKKLRQLLQN